MNDGVDAVDQRRNGGLVGQVAGDHFVVLTTARRHGADVRDADDVGMGLQGFAQDLPQAAGGAGEQNAREGFGLCGHGQVFH